MDAATKNMTHELLCNHIENLKTELDDVNEKRSFLLSEISKAEKALSAIIPKKQSSYNHDWTVRQKILHSLNSRKMLLSVDEIVEFLQRVDVGLSDDHLNASRMVRVQVGKMVKENVLVQYKTGKMRYIMYALQEWTDDIGEIKEKYVG